MLPTSINPNLFYYIKCKTKIEARLFLLTYIAKIVTSPLVRSTLLSQDRYVPRACLKIHSIPLPLLIQIQPRGIHGQGCEFFPAVLLHGPAPSHPQQPVGQGQGISQVHGHDHHRDSPVQETLQEFHDMDAQGYLRTFKRLDAEYDIRVLEKDTGVNQIIFLPFGQPLDGRVKYIFP